MIHTASCSDTPVTEERTPPKTTGNNQEIRKPPSTYQDTLIVDKVSAVFYYPDSIQLGKIKKLLDTGVFEGTMHEYFYQMRNAKMVIAKNWSVLKVIEAKNIRYLLFKKTGNKPTLVDLDSRGDPYGLFLFDPGKEPALVDMMNIEGELPSYFHKK